MYKSKNLPMGVIGTRFVVGVIAVLATITTFGQGSRPPSDVNVVNTPNVNVVNTPTVDARQLGSWSVGINGTPNVTVGNTAGDPVLVRNVENAARHPFHATADCFTNELSCSTTIAFVPAGKRLLIEYVSLQATSLPSGQVATMIISTLLGTRPAAHYFSPTPPATMLGTVTRAGLGQQVRIHAGTETNVSVSGIKGVSGFGAFSFTISGYLEDTQ